MQTYSKVNAIILVEVTVAERTGHTGGLHVRVGDIEESNVWGCEQVKGE